MMNSPMPRVRGEHWGQLTHFFRSSLPKWGGYYVGEDLYARIYQERQATVLSFVEGLQLPAGAMALDVGCGPGLLSVALAFKGYFVHAIDLVMEMACATRSLSIEAGTWHRVSTSVGNACHLHFRSGTFDLLAVVGVTEWTPSLPALLEEAARVLKPGGHLVIAADNKWSLHLLLEPLYSPLFAPIRRLARRMMTRWGYPKPMPVGYTYSAKTFHKRLRALGLVRLRTRMVGFGPFSILRHQLLPEAAGQKLNLALQRMADRGMPVLRSTGHVYVVLARAK